ncbi:hypothetical protein BCR35DRAFT_219082 [Leucosporidium creatinivorum]|uniref:F-box domain-containing protein n=1 Tax=Leucosporidium creatinivorum TaxID=106004 RepID=A0A1Y2FX95_9BASI|nr:hypothetical protein BCR35DRAFT_219082 [Leucosporidium creatinivorum]
MPPRRRTTKVDYREVSWDQSEPESSASDAEEERAVTSKGSAAVEKEVVAAAVEQERPKIKSNNRAPAGPTKRKGKQKAEEKAKDAKEPAPKRARTSKPTGPKKLRGNVGRLEYLKNMPLDILGEICSQAGLDDLLHLSRVDRNFRRVLMTKQSRHLWSSARENSGLPVLTATDCSEPELASLLYDKICMDCGRDRASLIDYYLRKRWCKDCKDKNFLDARAIHNAFFKSGGYFSPQTLRCTPSHPVSSAFNTGVITEHYSWTDVRLINGRLRDLNQPCQCQGRKHIHGGCNCSAGTPFNQAVSGYLAMAAARRVDGAALTKMGARYRGRACLNHHRGKTAALAGHHRPSHRSWLRRAGLPLPRNQSSQAGESDDAFDRPDLVQHLRRHHRGRREVSQPP